MPPYKPPVSPEDEELFNLIEQHVRGMCFALGIRDEHQIKDLLQEVLKKLCPKWQQLRLQSLPALVRKVTRQRWVDNYRSQKTRPGDRGAGDGKGDEILQAQPAPVDTPLEGVIKIEEERIIKVSSGGATPTGPPCITKLEEEGVITAEEAARLRQVFADTKKAFPTEAALWEAKFQGGKTLAQIAESTGLSITTVFRRIKVFSEALRDCHRESGGGGFS
jgi:RNA polymerase sigma factor (sigma-70 family)